MGEAPCRLPEARQWIKRAVTSARPARSVPVTSIYSRRDGIVGWRASIDRYTPEVDNVEVSTTHFGLGFSPAVLKILARKLAEGQAVEFEVVQGPKGPQADKVRRV